jgi:hypothetical protein
MVGTLVRSVGRALGMSKPTALKHMKEWRLGGIVW